MKKENPSPFHIPYTPAREKAVFNERYGLFINGVFTAPKSRKYFTSYNPATSEVLSEVAEAGPTDVDLAVTAAQNCYKKSWGKLSGTERGKYLFRIARLIQERSKELALAESLDGGKPIRESRDFDVPLAAQHFFYYAGWADKLEYAFPGKRTKALGVSAQIIPWNFPLLMAAWKIAPALATGNTVVLKPAESTSLSALILADIIKDSGLPAGAVNIITGGKKTGELLASHPLVSKVAFTGSTTTGKHLQSILAGTGKKLSLELGGKSAHIILEDAAINEAVESIIQAIFFNQGHVCSAGSRLYVQESIAEEVVYKLKKRMETLIVGPPLDKNTDIGAINNELQYTKINSYLQAAKEEGLEVFDCGHSLPREGFYCRPTLIIGAGQANRIVQEEIFGPVLSVQTFRTLEEVIEKANATPFGLAAGIWTDKGSRALGLAKLMNAGVVWINGYNKFDPTAAFGGFKESGFGREGGIAGLLPYIQWA